MSHCPRCGGSNPAEIHTCTLPASDHLGDATKMVATINKMETVEPAAWLVTSTDLEEFRDHEALVKHVLLAGRNSKSKDRVPLYATPPSQAPLTAPENAS